MRGEAGCRRWGARVLGRICSCSPSLSPPFVDRLSSASDLYIRTSFRRSICRRLTRETGGRRNGENLFFATETAMTGGIRQPSIQLPGIGERVANTVPADRFVSKLHSGHGIDGSLATLSQFPCECGRCAAGRGEIAIHTATCRSGCDPEETIKHVKAE